MIRTSLFVIATTLLLAIVIFQDRNERRVALVLSATSSEYIDKSKLFNTPTPDVALTLSKLGFEVIESIEPTREVLIARMREFVEALKSADVGLIYYSGKVAQFSGRNYLIPIDMETDNPWMFETYGVPLDPLLYEMERRIQHSFVFLNACRLTMGKGNRCHGLSRIGAGKNVLITHANQSGSNKNSHRENETVFVNALTTNLLKRDMPLKSILHNIYKDVMVATLAQQAPWTENGKDKNFVFNASTVPFDKNKVQPPKVASLIPITLDKSDEKRKPEKLFHSDDLKKETKEKTQGSKKQIRMDRKTAVTVMQKKLAEFTCYKGRIDGIWGRLSRRAVRRFKRQAKLADLNLKPGIELFKAVAEYRGPVCGRSCEQDSRLNGQKKCQKVTRKELPFIPVILKAERPKAKVRIKRVRKRIKRKRRYARRKSHYRNRRLRARQYRKRSYRARKARYRKYTRRRASRRYSRKARTRKQKRVAYYRSRQYRRNLWADYSY